MKVGMLCPFYKEGGLGGVETVIRSLLERLPEKGIDAEMVPFILGKELPYESPLLSPYLQLRAAMSSLSGRYDIVHSHHPFVTLPFALRRKTLLTFHVYSGDYYASSGGLRSAMTACTRYGLQAFERMGGAFAKEMTAVSAHVKSKLVEEVHLPEDRLSVIHNGVDLPYIDSCIRDSPYENPGPNIFAFGRLSKVKGFHTLLRAAASSDIPGIKVHIAGPDGDKRYKEELAALAHKTGGRLVGPVYEQEKYSRLRHADLVVMPSVFEGLSIAGVEALASGSAILASDIGPFKELFGDAALFFRSGDEKDLADKMAAALGDARTLRMLRKEAMKRRQEFSMENMVDGYLSAYKRVLDG